MLDLKKMTLMYGGKCAECGAWVERNTEAYYGEGKVYHLECVGESEGPESFEDAVLDRLADLHDRCKRIEDKLVSLCVPVPAAPPKVEVADLMGGKKL
jgi:hypothetical protein